MTNQIEKMEAMAEKMGISCEQLAQGVGSNIGQLHIERIKRGTPTGQVVLDMAHDELGLKKEAGTVKDVIAFVEKYSTGYMDADAKKDMLSWADNLI